MSKLTAEITLKQVQKIRLYINTGKKPLSEIKAETGADYIINGGLFNPNWTACCHLNADGYIYAEDQYNYWGYAWDAGPDIAMTLVPERCGDKSNYICCCVLVEPSGPVKKPGYTTEQGGRRGRTAMGMKGDSLCLYVSKDATPDAKTPEELRDELLGLGWTSGIMLDSGGSSQCDFRGNKITSGRAVHNLILVFLKKEDHGNEIVERYLTKNRCYTKQIKHDKTKAMLHSTGTPGAAAEDIIAAWDSPEADAAVEFVIDDTGIYQTLPLGIKSWHCAGTANNTHVACEICEPIQTRVLGPNWLTLSKGGRYNTAYAVTLLQKELAALGYDPKGIDGSFGPGCDAALRSFQKDKGLTVDGMCGPKTLKAMQSREGSFLRYPVSEAKAYFENVYAKAVNLFARLMEELGGNPDEILCHCEGYKEGIASNHADVLHWFPEHGKTMDDFRADVKAAMAPALTLEEAVDRLAEAGIVTAADYWKAGTYSAQAVKALIVKMASRL